MGVDDLNLHVIKVEPTTFPDSTKFVITGDVEVAQDLQSPPSWQMVVSRLRDELTGVEVTWSSPNEVTLRRGTYAPEPWDKMTAAILLAFATGQYPARKLRLGDGPGMDAFHLRTNFELTPELMQLVSDAFSCRVSMVTDDYPDYLYEIVQKLLPNEPLTEPKLAKLLSADRV